MNNNTILYISPNFPPLNTSRSIANAYYCMELEKIGYKIIILTAEIPKDYINYYNEDNKWFKGKFKIKRVGFGLFELFYRKKSSKITNRKKENTKNSIKSLIKRTREVTTLKNVFKEIVFFPDCFIYWSKRSYLIAKEIIIKYNPSIIITASDPNSAHILGHRLKRNFPNIKWIGYFGDPWSLEPNLNAIQKIRHRRLEKSIIYSMDKYIFTTKNTRDLYCRKFNIDIKQTSVYSRGYNPKIYNINSSITLDKNKINFVYAGSIAKNRNVIPLFEAIIELKTLLINSKINLYFIGGMYAKFKIKFEKFNFIKLNERVSFIKSIMFMKEADFLILLDNDKSLQLPAKVFEYLGTTTPIITITPNFTSPLSKLMKEVDRGPIIYNEKVYIVKMLKEIIILYNNNQIPDKWCFLSDKYKISNIVLDFAKENLNFNGN